MIKRLASLFVFSMLAVSAFGQGSWFQGAATTTNGASSLPAVLVVPNSSVTVCTAPATGGTNTTPCTNKVPLCTDATLGTCNTTTQNPVFADGAGNFGFWVSPGTYDVDVCSPAPTSCFIYAHQTLAAPGGGAGVFTTLSASSVSVSGNVAIGGPNPWYDVCKNGLACDGTTSDTTAFNTLIASACAAGGGTLWIPPAHTVRFGSAPNHIPCGLTIMGTYSKGSAFGFGSFILCDYTESTATNGCLWWDGANAATQGNGGGIVGVNIQKGNGQTGGVAVKFSASSCTARAGNLAFGPNLKISQSTGSFAYDIYGDGSLCTTAGTQGVRDISFFDVDIFGGTIEAVHLDNCVHCYFSALETSATAGSGNVDITGQASGTSASTDVAIVNGEISGNLILDQATDISIAGEHITANVTASVNTLSSTLFGTVDGTVTNNGGLTYCINGKCVISGTLTTSGQIQSTSGPVVAGSPASACTLSGEMCEATAATTATHFYGSDNQFFCRRNNGSGSGTNFTCTWDGGSTFPWAFDATNGETITKPFSFNSHMLFTPTAPTIAAGGCGGAAASIATNNGTASFSVNVGTTPTTACAITMPTASNGWNCYATDITTNSTSVFLQKQTATGATSVTITNFNDVAVGANFTASDILQVSCFAR